MRRRLLVAAGAVLALVAAFVAGRFAAPVRVETKTEWREKVVTKTEWKDRVVVQRGKVKLRVVTREVPGGERVVEKWIERDPVTVTKDLTGTASAKTESNSATRSVSEAGRPGWSAGVAATWDPGRLSSMPDRIGLELDRRIVGTLWLGVRASATSDFAEPQIGAAIRAEF